MDALCFMCLNFNPLHREGGDPDTCLLDTEVQISIHSTARVETAASAIAALQEADFNPLHREGGDKGH